MLLYMVPHTHAHTSHNQNYCDSLKLCVYAKVTAQIPIYHKFMLSVSSFPHSWDWNLVPEDCIQIHHQVSMSSPLLPAAPVWVPSTVTHGISDPLWTVYQLASTFSPSHLCFRFTLIASCCLLFPALQTSPFSATSGSNGGGKRAGCIQGHI